MRMLSGLLSLVLITPTFAAIKTQEITYKAGDTTLKGYLAYDDASDAKRPAILIAPEWWGMTEYPKHRAEEIAKLGYVGFAIDMYGDGKQTDDPSESKKWSSEVYKDTDMQKARFDAAVETLKQQPQVDSSKLAAMGYCFGGKIVLNAARNHEPLLGVVSFHGDLSADKPKETKDLSTKILVCHGAEDPMVKQSVVQDFIEEMNNAKADFMLTEYAGAMHAFTNPDADRHGIKGIAYNRTADERSWQAMKEFFAMIFESK